MEKERKVPAEIYSRIVGYFRPVNQWNKGKQEEFYERKEFTPEQMTGACLNGYKRDTKDIAC